MWLVRGPASISGTRNSEVGLMELPTECTSVRYLHHSRDLLARPFLICSVERARVLSGVDVDIFVSYTFLIPCHNRMCISA